MASSSFEYPPLDKTKSQIRLFEILPQPDSSLRYSLTTSDVSSCPNYIALSYVWGDDEPSNTIVINGQDFKIRDNLSHALPRLADFQSKREEKHFWIDAICINQEDTKERNHQVRIMKDIFTKASLTVAWLGVDEETSRLLSQAEQTLFPERDLVSDLLERLACNDYFQRMWIVQEMILSPKLSFLCDDAVCPWARMERHWFRVRGYDGLNGDKFAAASLASKGIGEGSLLMNLSTTMRWRNCYKPNSLSPPMIFSRLLHSFLDRKCRDPRDRIFSLLGLLPPSVLQSSPIPVDYDMSLEDLYSLAYRHSYQEEPYRDTRNMSPEDSENPNILFSKAYNAQIIQIALELDT